MSDQTIKKTVWTIGQLSRESGASARALRFYEDKGLLSPAREGQTRLYSVRDRARLTLILRGKRVGFTLAEIREMLDLYDLGDDQRTQMQRTHDKYIKQIALLKRQREDIIESIQTLETGIAWLAEQLSKNPADVAVTGASAYDALARACLDGVATGSSTHALTKHKFRRPKPH
ncbi:MerR family transcriptional regulator [Candidatus Phycosocius spiralis]|uniref:Transcriptional regulator n=1 Tax=Candidatus Phycosocius spiralis TaxID=2815099 RepID=A0ABQ4PVB5_9PROT|nr:MerR family DNA-binding transcriptional regulator [Candidatus Phycosocius spiralis]GIU66927.1 transcriptional regulator [Candidatus Phycosocius spiralis]